MKKLLVLVILISLLIPMVAFANGIPKPPPPECPPGMIMIKEPVWHEVWGCPPGGYQYAGPTQCKKCILRYRGDCQEWEYVDRIRTVGFWTPPVCRATGTGERCGRCSNIKPFTWVEWYDRDGGCDDDWYNGRVEYPNDERCGYVPPIICEDETALNYGEEGECQFVEPEPEPEAIVIPPQPVCPLQLLINYNPPEGWLSYCMVLTEGGVATWRQRTLCSWTADNHPCGGMVYDDGTEYGQWACDRYGYYRQPISVLKCLWARHLAGQRDQTSFDKCHEQ